MLSKIELIKHIESKEQLTKDSWRYSKREYCSVICFEISFGNCEKRNITLNLDVVKF